MPPDPVLAALEALEVAIDANAERGRTIKQRIVQIKRERAEGRSYRQIVPKEERPLIVQLVTQSATALDSFGVRLRRAEAQALYDEGLTMDQIAELFGVTRQRVSVLLKRGAQ
jgi:Homeodomain-like domain